MKLHINDNNPFMIRAHQGDSIRIANTTYTDSIIVSNHGVQPWSASQGQILTTDLFEIIINLKPEICILGTGSQQVFPETELMVYFSENQIGFEVMATDAASRTFNILLSEGRDVVAALIL